MKQNREIEKTLHAEIRDKKTTARSARHKVTHSGCNLPTYTQKELNAKNGQCVSYNLNVPMHWVQFTALPVHIQKEYLLGLARKFHVTEDNLPALLRAKPKAVETMLTNRGIMGIMKKEVADAAPDLDAWFAFLDSRSTTVDEPVVASFNVCEQAAVASKTYRKEHNLSQAKLGEMLHVNRVSISRMETQSISAHVAIEMLTAIKRLEDIEAAERANAAANEPVQAETVACAIQEADGTVEEKGVVQIPKAITQQPSATVEDVEMSKTPALTLSGHTAVVLAAIQRLFGDGNQQISVSITTQSC